MIICPDRQSQCMIETSTEIFDSSTTVVKIRDNEVVVSRGDIVRRDQDGRPSHVLVRVLNVLFQAPTAAEAYQQAMEWGRARATELPASVDLLGVSQLTTIDEEPGNGVEICGHFFRKRDVWNRDDTMVPPPEELKAIVWERNRDTPVGELLSERQVHLLERVMSGGQNEHDKSRGM
jgi:hypothetical protein